MSVILRYTGDGRSYIVGVPARDLTEADIARLILEFGITEDILFDQLTARGLYQQIAGAPRAPEATTKPRGKNKSKIEVKDTEEENNGIRSEGISETTDIERRGDAGDCRSCG